MRSTTVYFNQGRRQGPQNRLEDEPDQFRYVPRVRNSESRVQGRRKILLALPRPSGRLESLYYLCVETYRNVNGNVINPRFREVYDSWMQELILAQIGGIDIKGYRELCAEDLFERDIFLQRTGNVKINGCNGNGRK